MLFKRRKKPSFARQVFNLLWPRTGWRRTTRYIRHRILRIPGTPYAIAAGFACGAAVSMTPFPGFHFLLGALLAWAIGGSIVASAIGTVVGNPWTFPLIWLWIFELGTWILGDDATLGTDRVTMGYLFENPWRVLFPMVVGSVPTAIMTWLVFFWVVRRMVISYQAHRQFKLKQAKMPRREVTGMK